jgi:hypothetical protein
MTIESWVVVQRNELFGTSVMRVAFEHVAHIPIHANVVKEVIALKNAVVLHHPQISFRDKGFENRRCDVRVIEGTQGIANIVQQRADHIFIVTPIAQSSGTGLQAMGETVHRKATEVAIEKFQMRHHPVRQGL